MITFAPRRFAIAIIVSALRLVIRLTAMPTIGGRSRSSVSAKSVDGPERAVEHADTNAPPLQMRREIQQPERRMRTHHALLGGVERQEVAVGQQQIHHDTCCGGRTKSTISFSTGRSYQS